MKNILIWLVAIVVIIVLIVAIRGAGSKNKANNQNDAIDDQNSSASTTSTAGSNTGSGAQAGITSDVAGPVTVMPIEHATALLAWSNSVVLTDPVAISPEFAKQPIDVILVTDIHPDHFSTSTLSQLLKNAAQTGATSTTLIVPKAVKDLLPVNLAQRATVLANGQTISAQGFTITAVPMYNLPQSTTAFHTKGRGNGYIVEKNNYRVYIAGDTSATPEMKALKNIDIAFIPMNMPYTMTVEEAATGTLAFKPKIVYPYHYRGQDGLSNVATFKTLVNAGNPNIDVRLLNWYPNNK